MTQYKVYKGFPYSFTAKKACYYNLTGSGVANDNTTLTYRMIPYPGLDTTVEYIPTITTTSTDTAVVSDEELEKNLGIVEPDIVGSGATASASYRNLVIIGSGELPDYSIYDGGRYCLGTTGKSYLVYDSDADTCIEIAGGLAEGLTDDGSLQDYNMFYKDDEIVFDTAETKSGYTWVNSFAIPIHQATPLYQPNYTLVGDLKVDINYRANGFSTSSCFYSPALTLAGLSSMSFFTSYKIITKVKFDSLDTAVVCSQGDNGDFCVIIDGYFKLWDTDGRGDVAATTNEYWWIQCLWDNYTGTYSLYVLKDETEDYTLDTLPDVSEWQLSATSTQNLASTTSKAISFGRHYSSSYYNQYVRGGIDLVSTAVYGGNKTADGTKWTTVWTALK
jgi:hypothetical protein